jgi:hypothetical protein
VAKSTEGRKVLRELDKEREAVSKQLGRPVFWTAEDQAVLGQISSILDRKADFLKAYEEAEEIKVRLKISAEVRLLEQAAARLVKQVQPKPPEQKGLVAVKAARAANQRWAKGG